MRCIYKKRTSLIIGFIMILLSMLAANAAIIDANAYSMPIAKAGLMDTAQWRPQTDGLLNLNGEWELYWNQLLEPRDFKGAAVEKAYVSLPIELTEVLKDNGEGYAAEGYGTLRLNIRIKDLGKLYGLKFQYFSSAYKVWVNGALLFEAGAVSDGRANFRPQYLPGEIFFQGDTEVVEIVVQVSNFHHRRIKLNEVKFGTADEIQRATNLKIIQEGIIFGSLLLIALYYLILYFIQKREAALIYLSLIAFVVAVRGSIVSERILIRLWPLFPAELMMKLGYLPTFVLLPLLNLYLYEIFRAPQLKKLAAASKYICMIMGLIVCTTSVKIYDMIFTYGQWINVLLGIYTIYLLISNGLFKKTRGSYTMAIGGVMILIAAVNDILRELSIITTPEALSTTIVAFILLQALFLAWRFNDAFIKARQLAKENEAMFQEIQQLNKDLEEKIRSRTRALEIANSKLETLTRTDALTGLANRRYFDERIQQEWFKSIRDKRPLSVIMVDIDFFKGYNDTYGHIEGDECLKKITKELEEGVRHKSGIVARYGGEEFIVLLPNIEADDAREIAEGLRAAIKRLKIPHKSSSISEYVTISLGLSSMIVSREDSLRSFISKADQALYLSKDRGRDRVEAI